jgi:hypothetical protein
MGLPAEESGGGIAWPLRPSNGRLVPLYVGIESSGGPALDRDMEAAQKVEVAPKVPKWAWEFRRLYLSISLGLFNSPNSNIHFINGIPSFTNFE